jgi:protein-S-isoprenylcysteine O-methyltransferase Ste14
VTLWFGQLNPWATYGMNLTFRNVFLNLVYYGLTVVLLPWILLSLESSFGYTRHSVFGMRAGSALIGVVGVALQLWCIVLFQSVGKGTPSPAFAPIKLVAYSLAAALAFHLFIVFWEEPRHLRRFGERYVEYRRNVGRWWPMRWRAAWAS